MKSITKKVVVIVISLTALLLIIQMMPSAEDNTDYGNIEDIKTPENAVFNVKTVKVKKGEILKSINANGLAGAWEDLEVIPEINGYISKVHIYEGQKVTAGQMLLELDQKELRIQLKQAESILEQKKIEYVAQKREMGEIEYSQDALVLNEKLSALEKEFSQKKIDAESYKNEKDKLETALILTGSEREKMIESRSGLSQAKIDMENAELKYSYSLIKAPLGGYIADFKLPPYSYINQGTKILRIVNTDRIKIDAAVLESDIVSVKLNSRVEVQFPAAKKSYIGKVIYISPVVETDSKTCRVTIEISNPGNIIKPGMFASMKIYSEVLSDRIIIPKEALLLRDNRGVVFVNEGGIAKWRYVETGEADDTNIEITEGISEGEEVLTEGHFTVGHDAKIKVTE